ncbi:MAG: exodeoxyribonuclease VII large subunit [Deltaproteobacteria bacterium]|nr:exodeoxyribonuclease VII large subunit [Deltaproteobacteria bacterium]
MKAISVSGLVELLRDLLEENFVDVLVEGEISNYSRPASGHAYFTLKDARGQLKCAMFRPQLRLLRFEPQTGLQVICRGRASVYTQRGELQLVVESLQPSGVGGLQLAMEQLKQKLAAEGLFDAAHKRPLPAYPQIIGVVTSATGAAIHDIVTVLQRRAVGVRVLLRGVRVQGEGAAAEIAAAIADVNREGSADVLIVGRGGGSAEDLQAFNEELVARAIYASRIPVVAAVGHEIDFSIADLVADLRAPTPTAAAELVVKNRQDLEQHCDQLSLRLARQMQRQLELLRTRYDHLQRRLISPLETWRLRRQHLTDLHQRLLRAMLWQQERQLKSVERLAEQLDVLSPLRVLGRGYALARRLPTGTPVTDAAQVSVGDLLMLQLQQGSLEARVTRTAEQKK